MIKLLQPWHANLGKRQIKSPKIYIRDSGIYHSLLAHLWIVYPGKQSYKLTEKISVLSIYDISGHWSYK